MDNLIFFVKLKNQVVNFTPLDYGTLSKFFNFYKERETMGKRIAIKRSEASDYISIGEAFTQFIEEKEIKNISKATIANYKLSFDLFCRFNKFDEDYNVNDIGAKDVFHWMHTMKLEGSRHSSINHYLRDLRSFLRWCMDEERGYIEKPFKIPMMEGQESLPKDFNDDEVQALLIKPSRQDGFVEWRTWAIVNWVLGTGNRARTICNIKIGDVDFSHKQIVIRETKNKKPQIIPLSSSLSTALKEYIRTWRSVKDEYGTKTTDDDYLFPDIAQGQLTTNALQQAFAKYSKRRGVDKTNIHGLRHTFSRLWASNNGGMVQLQTMLGHSSIEMSRKYIHLYSDNLKDGFDNYSPLDTLKKSSKRTSNITKDF
jgi:integrase/recombinase XerD